MFIRATFAVLITALLVLVGTLAPVQHVKGGNAHGALPSIPSFASANNHVAFFEQFNSTANIDLAQTVPAGKNWYTTNQAAYNGLNGCGPGAPAATPSWYTASNSVLNVASNNSNNCNGAETMSFGWKTTNTTVQNFTIPGSGGFYVEGNIKWTPNCSAQTFIPDLWMQDINGTIGQIQQSTVSRFAEIDLMEDCCNFMCGAGGNGSSVQTMLDWTAYNMSSFVRSGANLTGTNYSLFHTWGALLTTMAQGGGTGSVCWYLDRVLTGSCVTWTSTGAFGASAETSNFEINFAAGQAIPLNLNYIVAFVP